MLKSYKWLDWVYLSMGWKSLKAPLLWAPLCNANNWSIEVFFTGVLFKSTIPNQFSQDCQPGKPANMAVSTCTCPSVQVNTHNNDGFNLDEVSKFMLNNLNTNIANNPLLEIFNSLVDSYRAGKQVYWFGEMQLQQDKFNLSENAQNNFGKYFEPEMLKYFNICGEILQTQRRWWRSGLLFSEQSNNIAQIFEQQSKECSK